MLYDPRAFITHAALLRQAFAHCAKFPTAASRRSLDRVSVPVWLIVLSDQLSISGLVSRYLTNYLMDREPISKRMVPDGIPPFSHNNRNRVVLCGISDSFESLFPTLR